MTHSTKRPPGDPPIPPATKTQPSRQMPPTSSTQFQPRNHLGDTQPLVTPATTQPAVVAPSTSIPKKPKFLLPYRVKMIQCYHSCIN